MILNPAPARPLDEALLAAVWLVTPNETEAAMLTGSSPAEFDVAAAAARLIALGPRAAVITLGGRGAFVLDAGGALHVPAFPVHPVDTVAAGDVFNGCLAVALAEGRGMADAVRFASAGAAIAVTRRGSQDSAPHRTDIDALVASATPDPRSDPDAAPAGPSLQPPRAGNPRRSP